MRPVIALSIFALLTAGSAAAKVTRYLTGNAGDVVVALAGPAYDLGGGGPDVDAAIQWLIDQVRGCTSCSTKVDVVILRATGSDGYNLPIFAMNGVDSVETLVITKRTDADTAAVETTIQNAEVVFFAGGDQCTYVTLFKGTKVETAVEHVHGKGGGIGGTSAGEVIHSPYVYDACGGSATSATALANPYDRAITFTYGFFAWPPLAGTLLDSHFVTRDRFGRLAAFLARQIQDGVATTVLGVGIDEETSVVVDRTGFARVMGTGQAYFALADHAPETCAARTPLTFRNLKIWKVGPGGTFDLANRPALGYTLRSVVNGAWDQSPY
ncbi:MAG TPA: Type 1 glutamine amidotransferase-like domain-containing protein [Thermoanaerobaculia bacterium]|nr:Type 1 glutamine amidotransferase-like domain-containing protein [Thermoanaerobaculia bacterium]